MSAGWEGGFVGVYWWSGKEGDPRQRNTSWGQISPGPDNWRIGCEWHSSEMQVIFLSDRSAGHVLE